MKILKIILLLILALILIPVIIFFGRGLLTPSINYDNTVVVDKSASESWAVMSDKENLPNWIKGFKRSELVSGTDNTVGAVSNIYIEENGQDMVMKETINRVTPNELLDMTFTMDFMDMDYLLTMEEKGGKTTITSKSTTRGNSLFAKSLVSFMTGTMKKQEEENLNNLKTLINDNSKNYFKESMIDPVLEPQIQ